ncbi:MAG: RNA polymerase sigma factor [Bacteroidia bacterium]
MLFRQKNISTLSDNELIEHYRKTNNSKWVGELFNRYAHLVYGVCMKYLKKPVDAEDAAMKIFEKLLEDLKHHEVQNFQSWLHIVSKNHCLMDLRKRANGSPTVDFEAASYQLTESSNIEEAELKEEQLSGLEKAINQLNEEQKLCIELFYLQEKCYQEVAETTGYTLKQVKSYIQNGKRNLKLILTGNREHA